MGSWALVGIVSQHRSTFFILATTGNTTPPPLPALVDVCLTPGAVPICIIPPTVATLSVRGAPSDRYPPLVCRTESRHFSRIAYFRTGCHLSRRCSLGRPPPPPPPPRCRQHSPAAGSRGACGDTPARNRALHGGPEDKSGPVRRAAALQWRQIAAGAHSGQLAPVYAHSIR